MRVFNVASRHARKPARGNGGILVVLLMMALVFVPVLTLHAAALAGATAEPDGARPDAVATVSVPRKAPG